MSSTFLDLFAGIGGFRRGMELAGHKCVGFCEFDKFAVASYTSMHLLTDEQREYIQNIDAPPKKNGEPNLRKRQLEIWKEEYRNGEWYANDIRGVDATSMPRADCWCFGFPCQDISIAGRRAGLSGRRSGLFYAVTGLIRDLPEENRPKYLFIENVKNLLSVNRGYDFLSVLAELDEIGYDAEWMLLNSKDFGVPQNRERVFIIGHFRGRGAGKVFYPGRASERNSIRLVGRIKGRKSQSDRIYGAYGIAPTISTCSGGNQEPKVAIPVLTPGRIKKRQNGRRFKQNGEPMFTLTGQDLHGVTGGCRIRKLTPKECFRLQGWSDDYFERAALVNSDCQLYKQAGNGVTVSVIQAIAERLQEG